MNTKAIVLQNRIMSIILMALAFMWLMPIGSFDPSEVGFWSCIAIAIVTEVVTTKLIKWAQARSRNHKKESNSVS